MRANALDVEFGAYSLEAEALVEIERDDPRVAPQKLRVVVVAVFETRI